jgi:hypothetical protein
LLLQMHAAPSVTDVPDNAPQTTYATVKVNGKIIATLDNSGSSAMTNEAKWRAERIAMATGGTIEKAASVITQSQWTPGRPFRTATRARKWTQPLRR